MVWHPESGQYIRVNKDYSTQPLEETQSEADRLNAGIKSPPMTEDEEAAFDEWLTRALPLRQTRKEETLCEKKQKN